MALVRLGKYFTLQEFEQSDTAARLGIENVADDKSIERMKSLCKFVLDPLRDYIGKPIIILSGYRTRKLNNSIPNSSSTSQHMRGEAADIYCPQLSIAALFKRILESGIKFDQLIEEGTWIHVSYGPRMRGQVLSASFSPDGVSYSPYPGVALPSKR